MTRQYNKEIFWSEEDKSYVVTFPDFPNLSAFGETEEEAIADATEVLQMAIDYLRENERKRHGAAERGLVN